MWITVYHNSAVAPMAASEELDDDPSYLFGEPYATTGGLTTWHEGDIVIILSTNDLTPPS